MIAFIDRMIYSYRGRISVHYGSHIKMFFVLGFFQIKAQKVPYLWN